MRKIFTLVVFSLIAITTINAAMALAFEMQTNKASGSSMSLGFVAGGAQTVGVDWGDGNIVTYTGISNAIGTPTTKTGTTTTNQAVIKVYVDGSSITNLVCGSTNGLISLDLSRANGLVRLTIGGNSIATLDVSNHTGLQQLVSIGGYNNCFKGINLSANTALTTLTIRNGGLKYAKELDLSNNPNLSALALQNDGQTNANSLNACSLDSIYAILPDRTSTTVGTIFVGRSDYTKLPDNDFNGSNATIATAKKWDIKISTSNALLTTDGGGCTTTDNFSLATEQFSLYPNPTKGLVQINVAGEKASRNLRVIDVTGKLMLEKSITDNATTLDTRNFPKGMYFISTGKSVQKLVVE